MAKIRKNITIEQELWERATKKATANQHNFSSVVSLLLKKWLAKQVSLDFEEETPQ